MQGGSEKAEGKKMINTGILYCIRHIPTGLYLRCAAYYPQRLNRIFGSNPDRWDNPSRYLKTRGKLWQIKTVPEKMLESLDPEIRSMFELVTLKLMEEQNAKTSNK